MAKSKNTQPFLDAIAQAAFENGDIRDWIVKGTVAEKAFTGAVSLHKEQKAERGPTLQPYYCNYHCEKCTCTTDHKRSTVTDAMLFLENTKSRRLAIHIRFKRDNDALIDGMAENYARRAACWTYAQNRYPGILGHDHAVSVVFCHDARLNDAQLAHFDKRISHSKAAQMIPDYPL